MVESTPPPPIPEGLISLMASHAAIARCAIFVQFAKMERFAKYFFLLLISLMVGHTANMRCAIFVQSAKIERFAEYFFLL